MRLDEKNSVVQTPCLYLYPIKSYSQKQLWWRQMTFRGGTLHRISAFLSITFDWIETHTWEWYQYVCFATTHRLICNMTYLNHHVTLTWDDLRSNFEIDLSRSSSICFEPARRENHIDVKIIALSLLLQNLFTKNYFHIHRFLTFDELFNLEYWLKLKTYRETLVARQMSFQMLFAILFWLFKFLSYRIFSRKK